MGTPLEAASAAFRAEMSAGGASVCCMASSITCSIVFGGPTVEVPAFGPGAATAAGGVAFTAAGPSATALSLIHIYGEGDVGVGARLSVGDGQQRLPAGFLEIGAAQVEWKCELAALSGEIFFEFARVGLQLARTFYELVSLFFFLFFLAKIAWIRANRLLSSQSGVEFEGD